MREITLNNKNYLLVDLKDNTWSPTLPNHLTSYEKGIGYWSEPIYTRALDSENSVRKIISDSKIIGMLSDILKDEDVCKGLVEKKKYLSNYEYLDYYNEHLMGFKKATDSFLSYLQLIELDLTKEYLLIQKL